MLHAGTVRRHSPTVASEPSGQFLPLIQLAITPVILLSGVGALMLTLTNRLGRVVDRTRGLAGQVRQLLGQAGGPATDETGDRAHLEGQLEILWYRARLLRLSVTFAGLSMLLACLLVLAIFVQAVLQREFGLELVVIFVAGILALISALLAFLRDIWVSLRALHMEVNKAQQRPDDAP